jgi:Cys-tRNA(Pro)/Cys-tRNA(Cys) deacylase
MAVPKKTHAMRVLDARGVSYSANVYDKTGSFHTAEEAAELLGLPLKEMYKTLVVLREADPRRRPLIVMIPSDSELDLKLLAASVGEKKLRMATQREAEALTGMRIGGISVLGLKRPGFEVLIDERARDITEIHISAGERGIEISLRTDDLVMVSGARFVRATT